MDSQAISEWLQLKMDRREEGPLYAQLYRLLQHAILSGHCPPGTRLPPSRQLAQELNIARNTVIQVYEQLTLEGYVSSEVGRGTFVADISHDLALPIDKESALSEVVRSAPPARLSAAGERVMASLGHAERQMGAFMPGVPDVSEFPVKQWARIQNRHWRDPDPVLFTYAPAGGLPALREALAGYLGNSRSVVCDSRQVIVTSGIHQVIDVAARLLCNPGDRVWIEEPSYWGIRNLLLSLGIEVVAIPVDSEGINPSAADMENPPRLIVVTPSHQYPLGMVMSLSRRLKLLEYARLSGCWILEDDYDSDFRYGSRPLPSLQGLDEGRQVIYAGSFNKTLFPGLRLGYAVVPGALASQFGSLTAELFREGQLLLQSIMTDFLTQGHVGSHIRRMRNVYAARRGALLQAIHGHYGDTLPVIGDKAGLHVVLGLPEHVDDMAVSADAAKAGIMARALSNYYVNADDAKKGLVLGYGCVRESLIPRSFATLAKVVDHHLA